MKPVIFLALVFILLVTVARAEEDRFANTVIKTTEVTKGLYMLTGQGGNLGLSVGEDGTFLIDDQYAPLTKKILSAIKSVGGSTPKFLINTHWHGDHSGGNESFGKAGSIIVAHENVRERLNKDQFIAAFNMKSAAKPRIALPVITFTDAITFHWNGDELNVAHMPKAHTDGDSYIHFKRANVIHTGDLYFSGMYPFIDADSGGSIKGMIDATGKLLELANDKTRIIPGHGALSNKKELVEYRKMLSVVYARIKKMKAEGLTAEQVVASKPTKDFDAKWGNGFLKADQWVGIVYQGI